MVAAGEENLATEALCFLLGQSPAARRGFIDLVAKILGRPLPNLAFFTQAFDIDGTIPDLVGRDSAGLPAVYVESKFWAGLTNSQPGGYLERLKKEGGLGLVFIAPTNRLVALWPELIRRCREAGLEVQSQLESDHHYQLNLKSFPSLGLTSWSSLLGALLHETSAAGEITASENLRQLKGLCDRMEKAGFLPLRAEELTENLLPRRLENYCGLVDDLTQTLVNIGIGDIKGLKATGVRLAYYRYLRLKGNGGTIAYSADWWAKVYPTPLWLRLFGADWKPSPLIQEALSSLFASQPPKAFSDVDKQGGILVPLLLRTGSERDVVLASLVEQVKEVWALLPAAESSSMEVPSDMVPEQTALEAVT
jgi:hypothetical protein